MKQLNQRALLAVSRELGRDEMMLWLQEFKGEPVTVAEFDEIMRNYLPYEQYYQTEVINSLKEWYPHAFVWKAAAGPYSRQGIPDVCAVIYGHFFGFEIKRPYIGKLSRIQEQTIRQINNAGGTAAVVSFWEQAKEVIDTWKKTQL